MLWLCFGYFFCLCQIEAEVHNRLLCVPGLFGDLFFFESHFNVSVCVCKGEMQVICLDLPSPINPSAHQ